MSTRKNNKLVELLDKADYAVGMSARIRDQIDHPQGLWYHAIGMFNAFYAINEEMKTRTQNGSDVHLTAAVRQWRTENEEQIKSFFGSARNTATHQGEITVQSYTEWETDDVNDTSHPVKKANVTVKGSKVDRMSGDDFVNLCEGALKFMRDGIIAINEDYKARGGTEHALPKPEDLSEIFKDFRL